MVEFRTETCTYCIDKEICLSKARACQQWLTFDNGQKFGDIWMLKRRPLEILQKISKQRKRKRIHWYIRQQLSTYCTCVCAGHVFESGSCGWGPIASRPASHITFTLCKSVNSWCALCWSELKRMQIDSFTQNTGWTALRYSRSSFFAKRAVSCVRNKPLYIQSWPKRSSIILNVHCVFSSVINTLSGPMPPRV